MVFCCKSVWKIEKFCLSLKIQKPEKLWNICEELRGSDAQGMMYLCDGLCMLSGLKASACRPSKKKENHCLALWKAKLNVIEFGC